MVDDYYPPVAEGFDRMTDIARYDRNHADPGDLGVAVDGHLKLSLDDTVLVLGLVRARLRERDGHWLYVSHRTVHGPTYGPDRKSVSDK
jgi:hypothetical protein